MPDAPTDPVGSFALRSGTFPVVRLELADGGVEIVVQIPVGKLRGLPSPVRYQVSTVDGTVAWSGQVALGPFDGLLDDDVILDLTVRRAFA